MNKAIVGALAASVVLFASQLLAAPTQKAPSTVIQYADLDIHQQSGAEELWARIHSAALRVCGPQPAMGNLHDEGPWQDCVTKAEQTALARVNSPLVSRIAGISRPAVRTANN